MQVRTFLSTFLSEPRKLLHLYMSHMQLKYDYRFNSLEDTFYCRIYIKEQGNKEAIHPFVIEFYQFNHQFLLDQLLLFYLQCKAQMLNSKL